MSLTIFHLRPTTSFCTFKMKKEGRKEGREGGKNKTFHNTLALCLNNCKETEQIPQIILLAFFFFFNKIPNIMNDTRKTKENRKKKANIIVLRYRDVCFSFWTVFQWHKGIFPFMFTLENLERCLTVTQNLRQNLKKKSIVSKNVLKS